MMRLGSLFAGVGGIDLGFQRAGFEIAWQVEIDPWCRRVLAKHWFDARRHDDVKTFPPTSADEWEVDVIAGGFPCQDVSYAGKGEGIQEGNRSGLWSEFARIVGVLRPRYVVVENVDALLVRGIGRVLGDLAALGYDAEYGLIPATAVGAPHRRWRLFIIAYAESVGRGTWRPRGIACSCARKEDSAIVADSSIGGRDAPQNPIEGSSRKPDEESGSFQAIAFGGRNRIEASEWWLSEPGVGRVVDGVSHRVDRLRGLGNAVVPQIAEWIAKRIKEMGTL